MESQPKPSLLKRALAKRCDVCPACRYARAHPDTLFGRAMHWHGSWCPFWKAWQEVYGPQDPNRDGAAQATSSA